MRALGTTTVEIKSGYGLTVADEVRSLQIARQFTTETTFLGAHVIPAEYVHDRARYVDLVTGPMLQAAAPYARWIDVFCSPTRRTPSTQRRPAGSLQLERRPVSACASTPTSWVQALAFSWRSSSARPASITAPTLATPMWMRSLPPRTPQWSRCFPELNSAPARPIPMPLGCSLRASRLRWRLTAIRGPVTPAPCPG